MSELLDLHWDVFVTPGIPVATSDLTPGAKQEMWSPISPTLIYGNAAMRQDGHACIASAETSRNSFSVVPLAAWTARPFSTVAV